MDSETLEIRNDGDLNELRTRLRSLSKQVDLEDYETTKLVTAASELARNIIEYAEVGEATLEANNGPSSVTVAFADEGPGIPDPERALEDGYSGAESNGLGIDLASIETHHNLSSAIEEALDEVGLEVRPTGDKL